MTFVANFSFKDMGLWFQGSLIPFNMQFQVGPLTVSVGPTDVAAKTAFWVASTLRMAWDLTDEKKAKLSDDEIDKLFERLTEAYNAEMPDLETALECYKRLFPHLTEEQIENDFRL
jgi:hypothetical protein